MISRRCGVRSLVCGVRRVRCGVWRGSPKFRLAGCGAEVRKFDLRGAESGAHSPKFQPAAGGVYRAESGARRVRRLGCGVPRFRLAGCRVRRAQSEVSACGGRCLSCRVRRAGRGVWGAECRDFDLRGAESGVHSPKFQPAAGGVYRAESGARRVRRLGCGVQVRSFDLRRAASIVPSRACGVRPGVGAPLECVQGR
jgi:hypothetical protein